MAKKIRYINLYNRFGFEHDKRSFWLDFARVFTEDSFQAYHSDAFGKKMFNIFPNSIIYAIYVRTTANNYLTDTVAIWLKFDEK